MKKLIIGLIKCYLIVLTTAVILFSCLYQVYSILDTKSVYSLIIGYIVGAIVFIFWIVTFDYQHYKAKYLIRRYKLNKKNKNESK